MTSPDRSRLRSVAKGAAILVAALVLAWCGLELTSRRQLARAKARWERSVGPLHPARDAGLTENEAARRLDAAARRAGCLLLSATDDEPERVARERPPDELLREHLERTLGSADPLLPVAVGELGAWLERHRADLEAVVEALHQGQPAWMSPAADPNDLAPRAFEHQRLQRLLVVTALDAQARGDAAGAARALEAAWTHRTSLIDLPSRGLVNLACRSEARIFAALRRVRDVPEHWIARLDGLDSGRRVAGVLGAEGPWILRAADDPERWLADLQAMDEALGSQAARALAPIASLTGSLMPEAPLRRAAVVVQLEAQRVLLEAVRGRESCVTDAGALDASLDARWPDRGRDPWRVSARAFRHAMESRLQADLTRETLRARTAARDGSLQDGERAGSCPGWTWRTLRLGAGSFEVLLAPGALAAVPPGTGPYPTSHRESIE